jgi:hypothetical protein
MPSEPAAHAKSGVEPKKRSRSGYQSNDALSPNGQATDTSGDYIVPIVHVHLPDAIPTIVFWAGLTAAIGLGVVDPPIGVLIGAGVVVARHQRGR